jgi:hypothetical protein
MKLIPTWLRRVLRRGEHSESVAPLRLELPRGGVAPTREAEVDTAILGILVRRGAGEIAQNCTEAELVGYLAECREHGVIPTDVSVNMFNRFRARVHGVPTVTPFTEIDHTNPRSWYRDER